MIKSPLCLETLKDVLRKSLARPAPEHSKVCAVLMRQMRDAGRSRRDARKLLHAAIQAVRNES